MGGDFFQQQFAGFFSYFFFFFFFSFSFVIFFIFCLFRLLFPVKITACATKSPFNQVFEDIYFKMNPKKSTFRQIFDTQNKNIVSFPFSNFGSLVLSWLPS